MRGENLKKWGQPKGGATKGGGPKFCAFFALSRSIFALFCLSLGVFSLNFGGVLEGRDPQMCTFGAKRPFLRIPL